MTKRVRNPFIDNLLIPYTLVIKSVSEGKITESYKLESSRYIRVYTTPEMREFLWKNLSMYARDMFAMIQHFTHPKYRYVILTYEKVSKLCGDYGMRRYKDTIRELCRMSIIDCKDSELGQYWYNPAYFSPSNRVHLFPECAVRIGTINHAGKDAVEDVIEDDM